MPVIYVPRVFGGTIILNVTPPTPPAINITLVARKNTVTFIARKP